MECGEMMTKAEVLRYFGGSKPMHYTTLWRGMKQGTYPEPIKIGPRTNRWLRSECEAALRRMMDARKEAA